MPDVTLPSRSPVAPPSSDPLAVVMNEALARASEFVRELRTPAGVVSRRMLGRPAPRDEELADHLIRERRRRSRMDGSLNGSLVETARATWELLDLGADLDHSGVVRLTGYLLSRQDAAGRWGEVEGTGAGFFSPGPIDQPVAPLLLGTGILLDDEAEARFAASCIALRSVLRAGMDERARVRVHVEALLDLPPPSLALEFIALSTVGLASPDYRPRVSQKVEDVIARQQDDGTWLAVPLVHALAALVTIPSDAARAGIRRAVPALLAAQKPSGAFDDAGTERFALIAVRALVIARGGWR